MSKTKQVVICGVCHAQIKKLAVICEGCQNWCHLKCQSALDCLSMHDLQLENFNWFCPTCVTASETSDESSSCVYVSRCDLSDISLPSLPPSDLSMQFARDFDSTLAYSLPPTEATSAQVVSTPRTSTTPSLSPPPQFSGNVTPEQQVPLRPKRKRPPTPWKGITRQYVEEMAARKRRNEMWDSVYPKRRARSPSSMDDSDEELSSSTGSPHSDAPSFPSSSSRSYLDSNHSSAASDCSSAVSSESDIFKPVQSESYLKSKSSSNFKPNKPNPTSKLKSTLKPSSNSKPSVFDSSSNFKPTTISKPSTNLKPTVESSSDSPDSSSQANTDFKPSSSNFKPTPNLDPVFSGVWCLACANDPTHLDPVSDMFRDAPPPTYQIVDDVTEKGNPVLISSRGYSFTRASTRKSGAVQWKCNVATQFGICKATVLQTGDTFSHAKDIHEYHHPKPHALKQAICTAKVKEVAREQPTTWCRLIVVQVMKEEDAMDVDLPFLERVVERTQKRLRAAMKSTSGM